MIFSKGFDLKSIFNKFTLQKALANHHLGVFFSLLMDEDLDLFFINEEELNAFLKENLPSDSFTRSFIKKTLQNEARKQEEDDDLERSKNRKEEGERRKIGGMRKRTGLERIDGEARKEKEGKEEEGRLQGAEREEKEGREKGVKEGRRKIGSPKGGGKGREGGKGGGGREGTPILHRAVDRLDIKMVEKLLEKGKGEEMDEDGNTPLHLIMGNWGEREVGRKIAEMIVKITKNFNNLNKMACTPIHMAVKNSQIFALEWALDWNFKRREEKRTQMKKKKETIWKDGEVKPEQNDRRKEEGEQEIKELGGNMEGMGGRKEEVRRKGEEVVGMKEENRRREEGVEEEKEEDEEKLFDFDKRTGPFLYSPLHLASYIGNSGITELFSRYPREVDFFQKNKSGKTARKVASKSLLQLKLLLKEEKVYNLYFF